MKRITALFRKMFSSFTVTMSKRPVVVTIGLLLFVNLLFVIVATLVAMAIAPSDPELYLHATRPETFQNFFTAFAATVMWLIVPNSTVGLPFPLITLALIVVFVGLFLFTGTVIATVTTSFRSYITSKGEGKGKLRLDDHIVILNYNNEVTSILVDLMCSCQKETVLIISDKTREMIRSDLESELSMIDHKPKGTLKLVVRKGNPFQICELEDVSIESAKGILIMHQEGAKDYDIVKQILKLSHFDISPHCPIGVECDAYETAQLVRRTVPLIPGLMNKSIQAFSHNRKLGQFLAISILCPQIPNVLGYILSSTGSSFYPIDRIDHEEYLKTHNEGIPVGTLFDKTFVLSLGVKEASKKRYEPLSNIAPVMPSRINSPQEELTVFIIGKNKKSPYMLKELEHKNIRIQKYETDQHVVFAKDVSEFADENSVVVILSDDSVYEKDYDDNVFLTLVELSEYIQEKDRKFSLIVEILEPDNQKSISEFGVSNVIVSTKIISFFATKLLSDEHAQYFYRQLLISGDRSHKLLTDELEIYIDRLKKRPAKREKSKFEKVLSDLIIEGKIPTLAKIAEDVEKYYSEMPPRISLNVEKAKYLFHFENENMSYETLAHFVYGAYLGTKGNVVVIGTMKNGKNVFFSETLDKKEKFEVNENDELIVVLKE
ncbi:MAG: hypothetical protein FWE22_02235 [Firmicutes bacterium]|nr:hypothetical protein [Bacillota bacterium]